MSSREEAAAAGRVGGAPAAFRHLAEDVLKALWTNVATL